MSRVGLANGMENGRKNKPPPIDTSGGMLLMVVFFCVYGFGLYFFLLCFSEVEMKRVPFHMTLIRDQNGLGLTIAGGKGSATNSDVSDCFCGVWILEIFLHYFSLLSFAVHFFIIFFI